MSRRAAPEEPADQSDSTQKGTEAKVPVGESHRLHRFVSWNMNGQLSLDRS